jgi:SsrA-binding protein
MSGTSASQNRDLISNRKAFYEYEILETFEVGLQLVGTEIKSLRAHGGSLQEAFIAVERGELWLIGSSIKPYTFGSVYNHDERRKRKLLAHGREISSIHSAIQEKGLTCIPLSLYLKGGFAKLKIALAKGKKLHDKREAIQAREDKRSINRLMKEYQ